MNKVSVIIPSRGEKFLQPTIDSAFSNASEEVEVIAVLDGDAWPNPPLKDNPRLTIVRFNQSRGMRAAISAGASVARGDHILKCDGHVMFGPGWDVAMKKDCDDNMILIPRRYPLDAENWCIQDNGKPPVDYEYLCWPFHKPEEPGFHGMRWDARGRERADIPLDETMSFQGSTWMMKARHWRRLGGMPEEGYGPFIAEAQQIGLKTQLGGGVVMSTTRTFVAHLHKGRKYGRGYFMDKRPLVRGQHFCVDYWLNDRYPKAVMKLEKLIERFWPVPTWFEGWQSEVPKYQLGDDGLLRKVGEDSLLRRVG